MGKFKVGDKVTLSEKFFEECPSTEMTPWVDKLKAKVEEAGYLIITDVVRDDTYRYRNEYADIDAYLCEEWIEPYEITPVEVPRFFTLLVLEDTPFRGRRLAEAPTDADIQSGDIVEVEGESILFQVVVKCGIDRESDYYKCIKSLERCKEFEKITRYYKMHEVREVQDGEVQDR